MTYYQWPLSSAPTPEELHHLYGSDFPGCHLNPAGVQDVLADAAIPVRTFKEACPHLAAVSQRTPRALLFLSLVKFDPTLYSGEPQQTGNCVGRGSQNARCTTNAVEIDIQGEAEQYQRSAWESTYIFRGHCDQGMDPSRAARVDAEIGFLWRREYPFADLSVQNTRWAVKTGCRPISRAIRNEMAEYRVGQWILPETGDEALDLLAAGYACHSGQTVGFSRNPNRRGVHPPSGRWNHDMASVGYDLSKDIWPVPVVFVANSWGAWNVQPTCWPRDVWGPPIPGFIICELDIWVDWFVGTGSIFFYADIDGVPAKALPDWGYSQWA